MALENELAVYKQKLPELLVHAGKFALIHAGSVAGTYDTFEDALKLGYEKFGLEPFLVKQITAIERIGRLTRDVTPCHI